MHFCIWFRKFFWQKICTLNFENVLFQFSALANFILFPMFPVGVPGWPLWGYWDGRWPVDGQVSPPPCRWRLWSRRLHGSQAHAGWEQLCLIPIISWSHCPFSVHSLRVTGTAPVLTPTSPHRRCVMRVASLRLRRLLTSCPGITLGTSKPTTPMKVSRERNHTGIHIIHMEKLRISVLLSICDS